MSTAKRSRQRQAEAHSASAPPASKRLKSSHVPAKPTSTLDFLVDEDNRAGKRLDARLTNGLPRSNANRVDESHAAIAAQPSDSSEEESDNSEEGAQQHRPVKKPQADVISISSAEESSELEEDEIDEGKPTQNGHGTSGDAQAVAGAGDVEMEDAEPTEEPTFGDLLQARHPDPIDVQKSLQTAEAKGHHSLDPAGSRQAVQAPSGGSLGTVLTQALKTSDKDLLESCFAQVDVNVIRSTIQRQQSTHIATLLERIAERIHKRPGRAGRLMIWIQWSLVLHGGYLANQPELMKKLKALAQVTRERANGLQPLLHLKGKLDFLGAQLEARRSMQVASRVGNADEEDDEEGVLYIEGQEQVWSSDDEAEEHQAVGKRSRAKELPQVAEEQSDAEAGDADLPNGFINGVEDDSSADEDDDGRNGIIDDEAEEASGDEDQSSNDEADSDATSVDEDDDSEVDESESEAVKQPKPQHLHRKR